MWNYFFLLSKYNFWPTWDEFFHLKNCALKSDGFKLYIKHHYIINYSKQNYFNFHSTSRFEGCSKGPRCAMKLEYSRQSKNNTLALTSDALFSWSTHLSVLSHFLFPGWHQIPLCLGSFPHGPYLLLVISRKSFPLPCSQNISSYLS